MILDPELLRETEGIRNRLREAEDSLNAVRGEFERSVRRLYIEGGSMREIANALGISHQRVHQLAGGKPPSWWQRLSGQVDEPVRGCSFCGKGAKTVGKLVAGPGVNICDGCISAASSVLSETKGQSGKEKFEVVAPQSRQRCSFCGQRNGKTPRATASGHQICRDCVGLAEAIVGDVGVR